MSFRIMIRGTGWQVLILFWLGLFMSAWLVGGGIQWIGYATGSPSALTFMVKLGAGLALGFWAQRVWTARRGRNPD